MLSNDIILSILSNRCTWLVLSILSTLLKKCVNTFLFHMWLSNNTNFHSTLVRFSKNLSLVIIRNLLHSILITIFFPDSVFLILCTTYFLSITTISAGINIFKKSIIMHDCCVILCSLHIILHEKSLYSDWLFQFLSGLKLFLHFCFFHSLLGKLSEVVSDVTIAMFMDF